METRNISYMPSNEVEKNSIQKQTEEYKNKIENTLNNNATKELAEIFGLNKEQITKLTSNETNELSNTNEVNSIEFQLAQMFGKYDEMIELNNSNSISIKSVIKDYEEYEERVA